MSRRLRSPGFTLLELLCAMLLLSLLLFLGFLAVTRSMEAGAISGGAQSISSYLTDARQEAMAQNTPVEVRIYAAPDGNGYVALQLHWRNSDSTTPPLAPPFVLQQSAVIDATPAHSSLVTNTATPAADPTDSRLNAATRCFHFLPDGSTDLATTGEWTLTLRAKSQSNPAHFPANWSCVKLDPVSGRAKVYQP